MVTATTGELARELLDVVDAQLTALSRGPLPGLELPRVLMGHEVGPDVRADLLFTLGLLHECGREQVGGASIPDLIAALLGAVQGKRTNTFYSYRVAETVGRFGPFDRNPLVARLSGAQRDEVALAADSTDWLELLDAGILPRNYAAVLARCEHARKNIGLLDDPIRLEMLLGQVRSLLGGHLDDSNAGIGRYDIYTVDIHLFCEPLAPLLGDVWRRGASQTLDLVDRVAARDGTAVAWGRSTGVLAVCHLIELAGLVARDSAAPHGQPPLTQEAGRWYARAAMAARRVPQWFRDGWVTAHQHRSSDPYRGLDRRLQMTLDCLGKLVDAAHGLLQVPDTSFDVDEAALFPERDEMVWFDRDRNAGVWSYRSRGTAFTLPLVGGTTTDYLPAPRNPGLYEVPVGSDLVTGTPLLLHRDRRYAGGGLPVAIEHRPGELEASYDGFPAAGHLEPEPAERDGGRSSDVFAGTRRATWRVDGRTLTVEERLEFDRPPHALALQVAEPQDRALRVSFESVTPHTTTTVDVSGIAEFRSCWGELPRLHQIDLEPATSVSFRWSVTPLLRVMSTAVGAAYNDNLYAPLDDRVRVEPLPHTLITQAVSTGSPTHLAGLAERLSRIDLFHLHWPEWLFIGDVDAHRRLISTLQDAGIPIVWTQHNLIGHDKNPEPRSFYAAWAEAADLVIHHSQWGRAKATSTYRFRPDARHVVIPHAHFGVGDHSDQPIATDGLSSRAEVEEELRWRPGALRLGIVGAPRAEKDVELAMRAVARTSRKDLELVVLSLRGDEAMPDDPRIVAQRYEEVPRTEYDRRLRALDALVMPFDPDGDMLTTGTVGDAVGFGLPTVASSWPFLTETLGEAAIVYGSTEDELVECLEQLDRAALARASRAAVALQSRCSWDEVARQTYAELDRVATPRD